MASGWGRVGSSGPIWIHHHVVVEDKEEWLNAARSWGNEVDLCEILTARFIWQNDEVISMSLTMSCRPVISLMHLCKTLKPTTLSKPVGLLNCASKLWGWRRPNQKAMTQWEAAVQRTGPVFRNWSIRITAGNLREEFWNFRDCWSNSTSDFSRYMRFIALCSSFPQENIWVESRPLVHGPIVGVDGWTQWMLDPHLRQYYIIDTTLSPQLSSAQATYLRPQFMSGVWSVVFLQASKTQRKEGCILSKIQDTSFAFLHNLQTIKWHSCLYTCNICWHKGSQKLKKHAISTPSKTWAFHFRTAFCHECFISLCFCFVLQKLFLFFHPRNISHHSFISFLHICGVVFSLQLIDIFNETLSK